MRLRVLCAALAVLAYASSATAASAREVSDSATPRRTDVATDDAAAAATGGGAARQLLSTPQFGHALRKKWYFTDNFTDMNHGFGGMTPRHVHEAQTRYVVRRESNPAKFGWGCPTGSDVSSARSKVAEYIGATSVEDLVMVENAM